ncbi:MAG: DUF393 domain-containing protein [Terrimonas sp.]|nr:DUF393 domain-containing protein [Terrimonas sp.]
MENSILLYDDHCPLCVGYTRLFVKTGLLKREERMAFSAAREDLLARINFEKGSNEIPLINLQSGQVLYGIDALLEILDTKIPMIKTIGNLHPVKWFLTHFYKFISFNRKVIVAKKCGPGDIDCSPAFHPGYRILFLLFFFCFNTVMLYPVDQVLQSLPFYHLTIRELQVAHFVLAGANCLLAFCLPAKKAIEYLGQVNMLALTCTLLFVPVILLAGQLTAILLSLYLVFLSIFIFQEYLRRMDYIGLLSKHRWISGINLAGICFFILYLFR